MALDIRNFEGQSWSALRRHVHNEYPKSSMVQELQSNSLILKYEDRALYGKYPGFEPFVLALCGYCGERFKISVLARHIAMKHADGKVIESYKNSLKPEVKNASLYSKKSKVKAKKDVVETPSSSIPVKDNKPSSKIVFQLDKKKLPVFTSKPPQFDNREEKAVSKSSKNDKKSSQKQVDSPQSKKANTKEYPTYLKPCSKEPVTSSPDDHLFLSPSKEKYDSKRFKTKRSDTSKRESDKFKVHNSNAAREKVLANNAARERMMANAARERMITNNSRNRILARDRIISNSTRERIMANNAHRERSMVAQRRAHHHISHHSHIDMKRRKVVPSKSKLPYNPDRHCGVVGKENSKPCTRPLTCKSHTMSLRRAVRGRSKNFDQLLADHHASKGSSKRIIPVVNREVPPLPMEISISPEMMKKLNLRPLRIPLVLNPVLSKTDKEICSTSPKICTNGVRANIGMDVDSTSFLPYETFKRKKKEALARYNELKRKRIAFRKSKRNAPKQPWFRQHGSMLYIDNNLPTFDLKRNLRKERKLKKRKHLYAFPEREDDFKRVEKLRNLDTLCMARRLRNTTVFDYRDWSVERKRMVSLASSCTIRHYTIEEMKRMYFSMIPETNNAPNIKLVSEYLGTAFPKPLTENFPGPENQFYIFKMRDYFMFEKYMARYGTCIGGRTEKDDRFYFRHFPDSNKMILEPIIIRKPFFYPEIILKPLAFPPCPPIKIPTQDERTWNLAMGTWKGNGGVAIENVTRMHFYTPSGPMVARMFQFPIYSEVVELQPSP